jgi:hypothetical protein
MAKCRIEPTFGQYPQGERIAIAIAATYDVDPATGQRNDGAHFGPAHNIVDEAVTAAAKPAIEKAFGV